MLHKALVNKFYQGERDGREGNPKAKGLKGDNKKAYENGYAEGAKSRTIQNTQRKAK